ncbi:putative membrane protein [Prosthecobacter debontii]|uniref:Putative membrane protein n=1 Tax=Prosthecobacter debontii TaxID=48467 RepID=A0A1T4YSE0_9BACT|nr:DUF420 domain-containing protein [Prosthecobacter debontii]SKB04646.1 putative membrane protein [Prosthecobacter debontii]
MTVYDLPPINATLNACATVFIILGLIFIKAGKKKAHIACMATALMFSAVFLGCYLYYHFHVLHVKFAGTGPIKTFYYGLLISHVFLAIVNLPMIIMTVIPALRQRWDKHMRIAKWTAPIWLYVSITGVIVYMMCYQWYGPPIR